MTRSDPLQAIVPMLKSKGVRLDPAAFHDVVNEVFHDVEAEVYDEVHEDMWASLPRQFELLAADIPAGKTPVAGLSLLDVGCGTGLSTDLLLQTPLGRRIEKVMLIDTSQTMLAKARERAAGWGRPTEIGRARLNEVVGNYDIILTCSVLHHLPDITGFLHDLPRLQRAGGLFMHLQDPNGNRDVEVARSREKELARATRRRPIDHVRRLTPSRVFNRLRGTSKPRRPYIDRVNEILLRRAVIERPLTAEEMWRITDLHVYTGKGVSLDDIAEALPDYTLEAARSYAHFGRLESALPAHLKQRERELSKARDLNGRELAAVWVKS